MKPGNALLKLSGISKNYSNEFGVTNSILGDITFEIPFSSKRITSILASNNGGKSTLLRIIAAIEKPSNGDVILDGEKYLQATGKIVLIPENSSSLPWLNTRKNIELIHRLDTCGKNIEEGNDIDDVIALTGLSGYENHYPHNDSLGFRFRISLAMSLMFNPLVLLLDDCFKKMKSAVREEIFELLAVISRKFDTQFLLATSDITEAIRLSGRILLMSNPPGRIYKEFSVPEELIKDYNDERVINFRTLIEKAYLEKNQPGSINFSI